MPGPRHALIVAVWLLLALLPLALSEWKLMQLSQLVSYGIFAMSLAFVWGQAGLLCFGQAIFFGIGAYTMAVLTKGMVPGMPSGTGIGLLAAVLLPGLAGLLAGLLMFRGRGLSGAYFAIVTLAAAVIAERAASHSGFLGGFNGLMNVPPLTYTLHGEPVELLNAVPVYYVLLARRGAGLWPAVVDRALAARDDPARGPGQRDAHRFLRIRCLALQNLQPGA